MNKRLEQMMLKAAEDMPQCYYVPPQYWEKFAELIVRECARVAKTTEPDAGDDYQSGRTWAGIDVLKHFGVE